MADEKQLGMGEADLPPNSAQAQDTLTQVGGHLDQVESNLAKMDANGGRIDECLHGMQAINGQETLSPESQQQFEQLSSETENLIAENKALLEANDGLFQQAKQGLDSLEPKLAVSNAAEQAETPDATMDVSIITPPNGPQPPESNAQAPAPEQSPEKPNSSPASQSPKPAASVEKDEGDDIDLYQSLKATIDSAHGNGLVSATLNTPPAQLIVKPVKEAVNTAVIKPAKEMVNQVVSGAGQALSHLMGKTPDDPARAPNAAAPGSDAGESPGPEPEAPKNAKTPKP